MITVITPSNRDIKGINVVGRALMRQTFTDFEWLIGAPDKPKGVFVEFKYVADPKKKLDDYWVLNKLYNKMIKRAEGELIVSIQDYTSFTPQALEKFWFHYQNNPMSVVTGVGGKYVDDNFISQVWQDPRERLDQGSFYETTYDNIEFNFCAVPKKAFESVGGFDEVLDRFAGMDGYSVVDRLNMLGEYKFFIDQTNKSYSLVHGRYDEWEERNAIHGPYQERREHYLAKSPKLRYL